MNEFFDRRKFIKTVTMSGVGLGLIHQPSFLFGKENQAQNGRVGIIGLDTSHSVAFTKLLNDTNVDPDLAGYRVVAAYPKGSADIESSVSRVPGYMDEVKKLGVEIVGSITDLISKVDVVLLETNDGRPHLQQALPVLKAGKRMFIDKPIAGSLHDVIAIFEAAKQNNVPVFSSSSLRYMGTAQEVAQGKVGKVLGADTYSPAHLEKTHPDLFWYGIHGVETLYTVMGTGCKNVVRIHTENTDVVVGTWQDGRVGTFRGTRAGKSDYGGTVYGENGIALLGPYDGYKPLLVQIVKFFRTGVAPVSPEETTEIYAFMEAADESKRRGGAPVTLESILSKAKKSNKIK